MRSGDNEEWDYEEYDKQLNRENIQVTDEVKLPDVVQAWTEFGGSWSWYNDFPVTCAWFHLLGQVAKDYIFIGRGRSSLDTRFHVAWIQDQRTGKSEVTNFFRPVAERVYEVINQRNGIDPNSMDAKERLYTFKATNVFTDSSLINKWKLFENKNFGAVYDAELDGAIETATHQDNGELILEPDFLEHSITWDADTTTYTDRRPMLGRKRYGILEGHGTFSSDEFSKVGVFETTQHKQDVIEYFQTLMNFLDGEAHQINKELDESDGLECTTNCERSIWGITFFPEKLNRTVVICGVLQRMFFIIRKIPRHIKREIRKKLIQLTGERIDSQPEIDRFVDAILTIEQDLRDRFAQVGGDKYSMMKFTPQAIQVLDLSDLKMERLLNQKAVLTGETNQKMSDKMLDIIESFMVNLNNYTVILAVLCALSERKFVVTDRHMRQASLLTQESYRLLVAWLNTSLKTQKTTIAEQSRIEAFKKAYEMGQKDADGWVQKTPFWKIWSELTGLTATQGYNLYKKDEIRDCFEETKKGRTVYLRLKR